MPGTLASLNAKGLKKFKTKQDCSTALIPPAMFPSILSPPSGDSNLVRLAAQAAAGLRCKEICSITSGNLVFPSSLRIPASKHQPPCTIIITPLAYSLITMLHSTCVVTAYQGFIKSNFPFTGKSVRRSFASAQAVLGVSTPQITACLRHKHRRTTEIHYIFPYHQLMAHQLPSHFLLARLLIITLTHVVYHLFDAYNVPLLFHLS